MGSARRSETDANSTMPGYNFSASGGSNAIGMGLGSILGPVGSIAGSLIGGLFGRSGQDSANRQNLAIAREQMAFQREMSSTAYQRSAADLKKAGLNRILALGKPASTPSGAQATMQNKNAALQQGINQSVTTALQAKKLSQEIRESNSRITLQNQQALTEATKRGHATAQTNLLGAQTLNETLRNAGIQSANEIAKLDREIKTLGMPGVHSKNDFFKWLRASKPRERDYWMQQIYGSSSLGTLQKWVQTSSRPDDFRGRDSIGELGRSYKPGDQSWKNQYRK